MTVPYVQSSLPIRDPGDVGEARRNAAALARTLGFDEADQGKVALVATEAGTNIIKHAGSGELLLGVCGSEQQPGVELLAIDRGPGMVDVPRSMQDGHSTAGSQGTGLGAIRRLSSFHDIYSMPGKGTVLLARLAGVPHAPSLKSPGFFGAVCVAFRGESVCGDQCDFVRHDDRILVLVVDGLGHGRLAFEAADQAVRVFRAHAAEAIERLMQRMHDALRSTRGAAGAIAEVLPERRLLRYVGIGNISATIEMPDGSRSLVSHNGTLGAEVRRIHVFEYPWPEEARLVMYSDGLGSRFSLADYPGLRSRDPSVLAGVLYRDHARGRDDVTVAVLREPERRP